MKIKEVKRSELIDILKGMAISLVVLGHAMQYSFVQAYIANKNIENILFIFIYTFHIPLFMFISGFLIYRKLNKPSKIFKKIFTLIYLFFIWSVGLYCIGNYFVGDSSGSVFDYFLRIITKPQTSFWYLWVLALSYFALMVFRKFLKNETFAIPISYIVIANFQFNEFGFYQFRYFYFFFLAGYLVARYRKKILKHLNSLFLIAIILYPVIFYLQYKNLYVFSSPLDFIFQLPRGAISRYLLALFGIVMCIRLAQFIKKSVVIKRFFVYLGIRSLDIYIFHIFFLKLGFGDGNVKLVTTLSIALIGALTASFIIRMLPFKKYLLPGR